MIYICSKCGFPNELTKRSNQQNKFLHFMIGLRAKHTGNTFEEEKCYLKYEHGFYSEKTIGGKSVIVYEETSKMNSKRMAEFIDLVFMQSNSEGINIMTIEEFWQS